MLEIAEAIEKPVFEIPTLPPSIPGLRLHEILNSEIRKRNGKIVEGSQVTHPLLAGSKVEGIHTRAAARLNTFYADRFILATGGILGGGFYKPFGRQIREEIFGLPVRVPVEPPNLGTTRQLQLAGIQVDREFRPLNVDSEVILDNLWCIGTCLYQADPIATKSFEGISLTTGFKVGESLA
jgi:glycerol-3-phosphate dehydrogenase subunit B